MTFTLWAALVIVLGSTALFSRPWLRASFFLVAVVLTFVIAMEALGHARPQWAMPPAKSMRHATLVAVVLDEPTAIYIWIVPLNHNIPIYVQLPWSEKEAYALERALQVAQESGGTVSASLDLVQGAPLTYLSHVHAPRPKQPGQ